MKKNNKENRKEKNSTTPGKLKSLHDLERIAVRMDVICRRRLPDGKILSGGLAGREPEIRQKAMVNALGGFIQKNRDYIEAVKMKDEDAIDAAIEKCAAIQLRYAKMQVASEVTLAAFRYIPFDFKKGGVCKHPSDLDPTDWPPDVKAKVVKECVHRAVIEGRLSVGNATIVDLLCNEELSVAQAACRLGITPEAIYQQLKRLKRVLPKTMDSVEVRWTFFQ